MSQRGYIELGDKKFCGGGNRLQRLSNAHVASAGCNVDLEVCGFQIGKYRVASCADRRIVERSRGQGHSACQVLLERDNSSSVNRHGKGSVRMKLNHARNELTTEATPPNGAGADGVTIGIDCRERCLEGRSRHSVQRRLRQMAVVDNLDISYASERIGGLVDIYLPGSNVHFLVAAEEAGEVDADVTVCG